MSKGNNKNHDYTFDPDIIRMWALEHLREQAILSKKYCDIEYTTRDKEVIMEVRQRIRDLALKMDANLDNYVESGKNHGDLLDMYVKSLVEIRDILYIGSVVCSTVSDINDQEENEK